MRLLIAGGRHQEDAGPIRRALDSVLALHPLRVLIHGGHPVMGVVAEDWARAADLHVIRYPANWQRHGRRAETLRNAFMLEDSRPDLVLAFAGGADTVELLRRAAGRSLPIIDASCLPAGPGVAHLPSARVQPQDSAARP